MRLDSHDFFTLQNIDAISEYTLIDTNIKLLKLDVIGTGTPDGTVTFKIKGDNGTYTVTLGLNLETFANDASVVTPIANGTKLEFDVEGWRGFQVILAGNTNAGTVTVKGMFLG